MLARVTVVTLTMFLGCTLTTVVARADVEPNNGVAEAEGPVSGGVSYSGTISNVNDVDTYLFYVSGEVPLDVHVVSPSNACLDATLGNADNVRLEGSEIDSSNSSADLTYTTTAGVNRLYLQFESCFGESGPYSFSIAPASAVVSGAATLPQNAVPGLHEYAEQAFGPLAANTAYTDTLLTSNDQNWLAFFTPLGQETVDVEATRLAAGGCSDESLSIDKQYLRLEWDKWTHDTFTSASSAQHLIASENCMGLKWEVIVKAGSLASGIQTPVAPPPPPLPSNACLRDRANLAKAELLARRYRHKLASHRLSRKARRNYRHGLGHAESLVKRYAALRHGQCPGGR